jgi:hypothetical protein
VFGNLTKEFFFFRDAINLLPSGILTWILEKGPSYRHTNLKQNRDEAHRVARALIGAKREELKAGTSQRDLMSLLGSSLFTRNPTSGAHLVIQSSRVPPYDQNGG